MAEMGWGVSSGCCLMYCSRATPSMPPGMTMSKRMYSNEDGGDELRIWMASSPLSQPSDVSPIVDSIRSSTCRYAAHAPYQRRKNEGKARGRRRTGVVVDDEHALADEVRRRRRDLEHCARA